MSRRLSRRNLLRGMGGVSLGLPLMSSLGCNRDRPRVERIGVARQAAEFPLRLVVVYIPNGNLFLPGSGNSWVGSILEPLIPFQQKLTVCDGVDLSVHDLGPGEPHQQGMAWLTGRPLNAGNQIGGDGTLAGWASGVSVDQSIAAVVGNNTPHKSLHFGVQSTAYGGTEVRTVISYAGSDQPIANETSPYSMFDLAFSELGADPLGLAQLKARRKSVLDSVGDQLSSLSSRVGSDDKLKLDQHLASVRDLEDRLDKPGGELGGACQLPNNGSPINLDDPNNYPVIGQLQMDLLSMALACDLTRVCTLQWSAATNNKPYPFLNYNGAPIIGDEHVTGHQPDSDIEAWEKLRIIRIWYMQQLAYLLAKLDAVPEGGGTMLDNTVVLLGSEIAKGNSHSHSDAPFLLAGGAGGFLKTGNYVEFSPSAPVPHNNLLLTIMNAMGLGDTTFGQADYCTGPLGELIA
jgi:hypothetical protein